MTTTPSVARHGRIGLHRPDPRQTRWTALDLARRRSLATARTELDAAEERGDLVAVVVAWRAVVAAMERAETSDGR